MAVAEDRFFETRAEQLAIVHLTRQPDVRVVRQSRLLDNRVDLLVSLLEDGQDIGRFLAVEVKHVPSKTNIPSVDQQLRRSDALNSFRAPVCLFVFSMDDDHGYWRWIRKPALDSSTKRSLATTHEALLPLDNKALEQIFHDVRAWYDL